jgi:hypothetical protein
MKIIHTFWTGPAGSTNTDIMQMKGGWLSSDYHWMSWALSCLQAIDIFGQIELVTDIKGREILIDRFKLPYTSVSTQLEGKLDHYHPSLWSLGKIYTYGLQREPFLHLDGDVYLWQKPEQTFLDSPLFAQNLDKDLGLYIETLKEINIHFSQVPHVFSTEYYAGKPIYASNAGIIGGTAPGFFTDYATQAFDFIDQNAVGLSKVAVSDLNFIFEQYLFYQLAKEKGIPVSYLMPMVDNHIFNDYVRFEDVPQVKIFHTVGNFKKFPHMCMHIAKALRLYHPDFYYHIIEEVKGSGQKVHLEIYNTDALEGREHIHQPSNKNYVEADIDCLERTTAAIKFLEEKYKLTIGTYPENIDSFLDTSGNVLTEEDRGRLTEIYKLELQRREFAIKLYKRPADIREHYSFDRNTYALIKLSFVKPEPELLEIKIGLPEEYEVIELGWNWRYDYKQDIAAITERNFSANQLNLVALLIPAPMELSVKEYYIDDLDAIIIDLVEEPQSLSQLLGAVEDYFPADEIYSDYPTFKNLVINTVKLLLYHGALRIIN